MNQYITNQLWFLFGMVLIGVVALTASMASASMSKTIKSVSGDKFLISYLVSGELEVIERGDKSIYRIHSPELKTIHSDAKVREVVRKRFDASIKKGYKKGYMDIKSAEKEFYANMELGGCRQGLYELKMISPIAIQTLSGSKMKIPTTQFMTQMHCERPEM